MLHGQSCQPSLQQPGILRHQLLLIGIYQSSKNGRKCHLRRLWVEFEWCGVLPAPPIGGHLVAPQRRKSDSSTIVWGGYWTNFDHHVCEVVSAHEVENDAVQNGIFILLFDICLGHMLILHRLATPNQCCRVIGTRNHVCICVYCFVEMILVSYPKANL